MNNNVKNGILLMSALAILLSGPACPAQQNTNPTGSEKIIIYFFWGQGCPHCTQMKPFIGVIQEKYPRLEVRSMEVFNNEENSKLFDETAQAYGKKASVVPTMFISDQMIEGYDGPATENKIESLIINCTLNGCKSPDRILSEYRSRPPATTTTSSTTSTTSSTSTTIETTTTATPTTTTTESASTTPKGQTTTTTEPATTTTNKESAKTENDKVTIILGTILVVMAAAMLLYKHGR